MHANLSSNLYNHRPAESPSRNASPSPKPEVLRAITVNATTMIENPEAAWADDEWLYTSAWCVRHSLLEDSALKRVLIRRCQATPPSSDRVDQFFDDRLRFIHVPAQLQGVCLPIESYCSEPFILIGERGLPLFGVHPAFFLGINELVGKDAALWITEANPRANGLRFSLHGHWAAILMPRQALGLMFDMKHSHAAIEQGVATAAGIFYSDSPATDSPATDSPTTETETVHA